MENITLAEKNKMALTYGVILGAIYMVFATAENMLIGKMLLFYIVKFILYVMFLLLVGVFATRIKVANGGYITFKEVFGAIFIMMLVSGLIYYIYNYIYFAYIDPHFMEKIKAATITFMEKQGVSDDKIEATSRQMDKQMAESKLFSLSKNLMNYVEMLLLDSLVGLIVAAIVKKEKPMFSNM